MHGCIKFPEDLKDPKDDSMDPAPRLEVDLVGYCGIALIRPWEPTGKHEEQVFGGLAQLGHRTCQFI